MTPWLQEYRSDHILKDLDLHVTKEIRDELTAAKTAVETEMDWKLRGLSASQVLFQINQYEMTLSLRGMKEAEADQDRSDDESAGAVNFTDEELAGFGEELLDRYMEILRDPEAFLLCMEEPCVHCACPKKAKASGLKTELRKSSTFSSRHRDHRSLITDHLQYNYT